MKLAFELTSAGRQASRGATRLGLTLKIRTRSPGRFTGYLTPNLRGRRPNPRENQSRRACPMRQPSLGEIVDLHQAPLGDWRRNGHPGMLESALAQPRATFGVTTCMPPDRKAAALDLRSP